MCKTDLFCLILHRTTSQQFPFLFLLAYTLAIQRGFYFMESIYILRRPLLLAKSPHLTSKHCLSGVQLNSSAIRKRTEKKPQKPQRDANLKKHLSWFFFLSLFKKTPPHSKENIPLKTINITLWKLWFILCLLLFSQVCFQASTSQ